MGLTLLATGWAITIAAALVGTGRGYVIAAAVTAVLHFVLAVGGCL